LILVLGLAIGTCVVCPVAEASGAGTSAATAGPPPALEAVACPTATYCIAVGGDDGVLASHNGGLSWTDVLVPTSHFLYGVACPTQIHCVAVGDLGTALVTDDGGRSWTVRPTGTHVPLTSVSCPSASRCVAVGDGVTVVTSDDGGQHWRREPGDVLGTADAVACSSTSQCTAVTSNANEDLVTSYGSPYRTVSIPFGPLDALFPMHGIACTGQQCVGAGGHGLLARSSNGGATWSALDGGTIEDLQGVACPTIVDCVVVGPAGSVLITSNGGTTWTTRPSQSDEPLLGVACPTSTRCVAVGGGGTVVNSADGGNTWTVRAGRPAPQNSLPVLVLGDSFAHTLAVGLARNAPAYGITLIDRSSDGCSLARGSPVLVARAPQTVTGPCAPTGPGWQGQYEADVAAYHPALSLLVLGPWDLTTRYIGGTWSTPGQRGYDAYYVQQVDSAIRILSADGARVAVTTVPEIYSPRTPPCFPSRVAPNGACPDGAQRVAALNAAASRAVAASGRHAVLIDLSRKLSPNGAFIGVLHGVTIRASDGVHMSEPGDEWLAPWLLPQLAAEAGRPAS